MRNSEVVNSDIQVEDGLKDKPNNESAEQAKSGNNANQPYSSPKLKISNPQINDTDRGNNSCKFKFTGVL